MRMLTLLKAAGTAAGPVASLCNRHAKAGAEDIT
jgi:hypothetical protein